MYTVLSYCVHLVHCQMRRPLSKIVSQRHAHKLSTTTAPAEPVPADAPEADTPMEDADAPKADTPMEDADAPPKPPPRIRPQRADDGEDPLEAFMKLNEKQLAARAQPAAADDEPDPLDAFMAAEIVPQVHKAFAPVRAAVADGAPGGGVGEAMQLDAPSAPPNASKDGKDGAAGKAAKRKRSAIRYEKSDESDVGEEENSEDDLDDAVRFGVESRRRCCVKRRDRCFVAQLLVFA